MADRQAVGQTDSVARDDREVADLATRAAASAFLRWRPLVVAPVALANVTMFALSGAEPARVRILAVGLVLMTTAFTAESLALRRHELSARWLLVSLLSTTIAIGTGMAITGGIHSPMLPLLFAPAITALAAFGRSHSAVYPTAATLIVVWARESRQNLRFDRGGRAIEAAVVFAALVISTHVVFAVAPDARGWVPQQQHLTTPFLVWAALRFGLRGSTLALATYALMTIWYTTNGTGPFVAAHADPGTTLLTLQVYVGLLGVMILIGAGLMTERRDAFADTESWRRRFEAAIKASDNLVFEIHADSGHIDWAGDTRAVLGLATRDLETTRLWTGRVHPDDRERLLGIRRKMGSGALKSVKLEYRVRREDDTYRLMSVSAYAVKAPASELSVGRSRGWRIIGFVEDITEKKHADAERVRL